MQIPTTNSAIPEAEEEEDEEDNDDPSGILSTTRNEKKPAHELFRPLRMRRSPVNDYYDAVVGSGVEEEEGQGEEGQGGGESHRHNVSTNGHKGAQQSGKEDDRRGGRRGGGQSFVRLNCLQYIG